MSAIRPSRSVIMQATVWIGLFLLFTLTGNTAERTGSDYLLIVLRIGGFAVYYNVLYYLVLPRYFAGNKSPFYLWGTVAFLVYAAYSIGTDMWLLEASRRGGGRPVAYLIVPAVFIGLAIFGVAATFRGFLAFEAQRQAEREANRQRLEAEIALLKSQINPHFLLNTINNLYALALTEPDKTPDALLKLSEMVSYILYECASPRVRLSQDIQFIESYIELQRLRLPPNAELQVDLPTSVEADLMIEPMILVPFIENAFKHGLTTQRPCTIAIVLRVEHQRLALSVENLLLPPKQRQSGNPSGIGMVNTQQRLAHSYAGRYSLDVTREGELHRVFLELNLAE